METFENLVEHTFFSALFGGAVFMLMGCITWFFPPKNINALYGYRTKGAMQSQERWEFAQKFSSIQMIKAGAVILVLSPLGYFLPFSGDVNAFVGVALLIAATAYLFTTTEKALKKKFKD